MVELVDSVMIFEKIPLPNALGEMEPTHVNYYGKVNPEFSAFYREQLHDQLIKYSLGREMYGGNAGVSPIP